MFYGFLLYLITTIVMVFGYPTQATPTPVVLPILWNIGALMILIGGYWFFFFLRVDVAHEGHSPFRLVRADLFIVSLLASVTFALVWEIVQAAGNLTATKIAFGLYIFFTTLLFVSVPWSKFAHMFYKPAAAFQRRVEEANGSSDLPTPAARNAREVIGMPTFVYMTRCDGCGQCVDICPSDIMHIDRTYRRAYNIEPNFCWECYSCVKACPQHAIDVRGYADFAPLGHKVRVLRDEEKGMVSWKIKYRDGRVKEFDISDQDHPVGFHQVAIRL